MRIFVWFFGKQKNCPLSSKFSLQFSSTLRPQRVLWPELHLVQFGKTRTQTQRIKMPDSDLETDPERWFSMIFWWISMKKCKFTTIFFEKSQKFQVWVLSAPISGSVIFLSGPGARKSSKKIGSWTQTQKGPGPVASLCVKFSNSNVMSGILILNVWHQASSRMAQFPTSISPKKTSCVGVGGKLWYRQALTRSLSTNCCFQSL